MDVDMMEGYSFPSAFPIVGEHLRPEVEQPGMSLRDYFAAHAPHEPQPWFTPDMDHWLCPAVPSVSNIQDDALRHAVKTAEDCCIDPETPEAAEWIANRDRIAAEQAQWQVAFRRERYVQWPYAWADEMLEMRAC